MTAEGYRFSAEFLEELESAVSARLQRCEEAAIVERAAECASALAVAFERPAGHPTDPPSAA